MKKVFLLEIFILAFGMIKAQTYIPFPDTNAFWNELRYYQGQCEPPEFCTYTYYFQGDTILDTQSYHKIYSNDSFSISYVGGLREINKKIYFFDRDCSAPILLYDFGLNVGDSIPLACMLCDAEEPQYMKVISIDSVLIGDMSYRKRINFDYGPSQSWIEGIGSVSGLFYPYYSCVLCICGLELVCFEQNNMVLYQNEDNVNCFNYFVSVDEPVMNALSLIVFPNPVKNKSILHIESERESITSIELYDILGRKLNMLQKCNSKKIQLQTETWNKGIYFLKIDLSNGHKFCERLIIE